MHTDKNGTKSSIHDGRCLQDCWNRGFQAALLLLLVWNNACLLELWHYCVLNGRNSILQGNYSETITQHSVTHMHTQTHNLPQNTPS